VRINARAKFGTRAFQRVGGWRGEDAAYAVGAETIQQVLEVVGGKARTSGIVHEHPIVSECARAQCGKTLPHGVASLDPSSRKDELGRAAWELGESLRDFIPVGIVGGE
jgi:hypothetical protein